MMKKYLQMRIGRFDVMPFFLFLVESIAERIDSELKMPRKKTVKENRTQSRARVRDKLAARLVSVGDLPRINPDMLYRMPLVPLFLGLELPQIYLKIEAGEFPKPVLLSAAKRGARGYYGSTLLEIKEKRLKEVEAA
jgi:predicted DNA-binding transcriptional regulator AlpA